MKPPITPWASLKYYSDQELIEGLRHTYRGSNAHLFHLHNGAVAITFYNERPIRILVRDDENQTVFKPLAEDEHERITKILRLAAFPEELT